jgi:hypothetical protein
MKPKLVIVTGHRTNTLRHQLNHYKDMVSEVFLVVYENANSSDRIKGEVEDIAKEFGIEIHSVKSHRPFDWEHVTYLYNKTKMLFPNDWWIIADDDELQVYSKLTTDITKICDESGYEFVTGGFVDRIGKNGTFAELTPDCNIWETFPMAGFFRYPLSGACPNKVTMCKGYIEVTPGQHYAKINGETTWKWQGWNHPLRFPTTQNFTQVHHFKWDSTALDRLQDVARIGENYSFSNEYQTMYDAIKQSNFKIDIYDERFLFEEVKSPNYWSYKNWNKLSKIILSV